MHGLSRIRHALVGPAFKEIVAKYRDQGAAANYLAEKVRKGGAGVWGAIPMPAQVAIKDDELGVVVRWIIGGASRE